MCCLSSYLVATTLNTYTSLCTPSIFIIPCSQHHTYTEAAIIIDSGQAKARRRCLIKQLTCITRVTIHYFTQIIEQAVRLLDMDRGRRHPSPVEVFLSQQSSNLASYSVPSGKYALPFGRGGTVLEGDSCLGLLLSRQAASWIIGWVTVVCRGSLGDKSAW